MITVPRQAQPQPTIDVEPKFLVMAMAMVRDPNLLRPKDYQPELPPFVIPNPMPYPMPELPATRVPRREYKQA